MATKKGLGRGLGALFGDNLNDELLDSDEKNSFLDSNHQKQEIKNVSRETLNTKTNNTLSKDDNIINENSTVVAELPINCIYPDPDQPRKVFEEDALLELTNSIRIHGVITPLVVVKKGDKYIIVAGERRYRACLRAGILNIPCLVKKYSQKEIKEIALVDNLQRENLNPIETANAIKQLMLDYGYTQEKVADRVGKSRSNVANTLRLLSLPPTVIDMISKNQLSSGHARCLVTIEDENKQIELANKCVKNSLSVREFEILVKNYLTPASQKQIKPVLSIELQEFVNKMKRVFGTKVSVLGNDKKGRITIDYFSRDDLDRFVEIINSIK